MFWSAFPAWLFLIVWLGGAGLVWFLTSSVSNSTASRRTSRRAVLGGLGGLVLLPVFMFTGPGFTLWAVALTEGGPFVFAAVLLLFVILSAVGVAGIPILHAKMSNIEPW